MIDGFDTQSIALVGAPIIRTFAQPLAALGPLLTWGMAGTLIGAIALGAAADRIGRRFALAFSMVLFASATYATSRVQSFEYLAVLRLVTGIGLGGAMPSLYALSAEYSPPRMRALVVTAVSCGAPLGAALAGLFCAWVVPDHGWRIVFEVGGLLPLALLPLIWILVPGRLRASTAPARIATPDRQRGRLSARLVPYLGALFGGERRAGTLLLWLICFPASLTASFLTNWLPALADHAGASVRLAIVAGALLNFGGVGGGLLISRMIDRYGPYAVLGRTFPVAALCIALIGWTLPVPALFLGGALLVGVVLLGSTMCIGPLATLYYPVEVRGIGVGFALAFSRSGAVFGPLVGGLLVGAGTPTTALLAVIAANTLLPPLALYGMVKLTRPVGGARLLNT